MEQGRPADSNSSEEIEDLYDYLYRDSNRLASYSAQFWGIVAQAIERIDTELERKEKATKIGPAIAATHEEKKGEDRTRSSKETGSVHDVVTTDVISRFLDRGVIQTDIENAPHHSVILVKGTIVFVDRQIPKMAMDTMDILASNMSLVPGMNPAMLAEMDMAKNFFKNIDIPSVFVLQTDELDSYDLEIQVCGTLKESGMEEPISNYYFKHGEDGLADVYLLAIKEIPSTKVSLSDTKMVSMGQQMGATLRTLIFPDEAIMSTPIAIFRKI